MTTKTDDLARRAREQAQYGNYWAGKVVGLIEKTNVLDSRNAQLMEVLDDIEASLRAGDITRALKCGYTWSQRKDDILAGNETWQDQHIGPVYTGDDKH